MKTFKNQAAQGDTFFRRIAEVPVGAVEIPSVGGKHIVAHSETGHHHVFEAEGVHFFTVDDPMICYLRIDESHAGFSGVADLLHLRPFDTHETMRFTAGCYEMRRQREASPEGWRRIED
jgi:hypothetical protein